MGFLGMSGKTWKKIGKIGLQAAGIAATPFVGPAASMAINAGLGAASGAMGGGGWKGALTGGALGAIPGGGAGGAAAGGVAKAGLKELAKGVAKNAATNFATGTATGALTGQGLKGSLASGLSSAGNLSAGGGASSLGQAAKTVGKNVAVNAGGQLAAKGLTRAGVPGELAATGGNVFSNYLGNQFNKPAVSPTTKGFTTAGTSGGATFAGVPTGGGGGLIQSRTPVTSTTGLPQAVTPGGGNQLPTGTTKIPNTMGLPQAPTSGGQIPRGANPIPTTTGQTQAVTGQAPTTPDFTGGVQQQQQQTGQQPQTFGQKYGPLIVQGAGMVGGAIAGQQATKMAQKRSPEEQAALDAAQASAGQLGRFGGQAWNQGQDLQRAPGQYFQTLLSGNRAAMSQALAGPTAQITGNYRGAQRGLDQAGVRGAARDVAQADLNRDRVSKIASLSTGVQPYAAEQLTSMGQQQQALAPGMLATSGQLQSNLLGQGASNRAYARQEGERTAGAIGGLARDVGEVVFKPPQQPATSNVPGAGQQTQQTQQAPSGVAQAPPGSQTRATTKPPSGKATPPPVAPVTATAPTAPINGNQAWRGVAPPFSTPMPAGGQRYGYTA